MAKLQIRAKQSKNRPRVVFDTKMPKYKFAKDDGYSLSVDRQRTTESEAAKDCLSNLSLNLTPHP